MGRNIIRKASILFISLVFLGKIELRIKWGVIINHTSYCFKKWCHRAICIVFSQPIWSKLQIKTFLLKITRVSWSAFYFQLRMKMKRKTRCVKQLRVFWDDCAGLSDSFVHFVKWAKSALRMKLTVENTAWMSCIGLVGKYVVPDKVILCSSTLDPGCGWEDVTESSCDHADLQGGGG